MKIKITRSTEEGGHPIVSNLIKKPDEDRSVIELLSETCTEKEVLDVLQQVADKKYPNLGLEGTKYDWELRGRASQLIPMDMSNDWATYVMNCGRGYGKTKTGSAWVCHLAEKFPGCRIALVGATDNDVKKTIVSGNSGIIDTSPPWFKAVANTTSKSIKFPNGSECEYFAAEKPDRLRGRNFNFAWVDEITSWRYLRETKEMLDMTLRIGFDNRTLVTTTPKNLEAYIDILKDPTTWTFVGSTYDNRNNLTSKFFNQMQNKYEGTRLGQQELEAEILADDESALWKRSWIDNKRVRLVKEADGTYKDLYLPDMLYSVVAIDPAVSTNKKSAETAICAAGYGEDGYYYVFYCDSSKYKADEWARKVYEIYDQFLAGGIVVETNQGGDLVIENLRKSARLAPIYEVHARRGKFLRAEPVAALYERGKVRHVGTLQKLEDQMCNFNQHENKGLVDCVDAMVYALKYLSDKVESHLYGYADYLVAEPRTDLINFRFR